MTRILDRTAPTDAPILDVLAERWSTRIFDPRTPIDEAALASALEAARWLVGRRGWFTMRDFLTDSGD